MMIFSLAYIKFSLTYANMSKGGAFIKFLAIKRKVLETEVT